MKVGAEEAVGGEEGELMCYWFMCWEYPAH